MYSRKCEQCGSIITAKYKSQLKRFCSHKCSNQWKWDNVRERKEFIEKRCSFCGKTIKIETSNHRIKKGQSVWFCDHKCESNYRKSKREIKTCPICGCSFYKPKQITCSSKCGYELKKLNAYCKKNNLQNLSYSEYLELKKKEEEHNNEKLKNSIKVQTSNGCVRYYNVESFSYKGRESEYLKKYNKEHSKERYQKHKKRMKEDEVYRLKHKMRNIIGSSFRRRNLRKNNKTELILGCSFEDFKKHIESKFEVGMTFDNYGEWEIDHIIPLATAHTTEDVEKLCHYSNLQPLWSKDNRLKSDKLYFN